jgi:hypothetical protein
MAEEVGVLPEGLSDALRSIAGPFLWRHYKSATKVRSLLSIPGHAGHHVNRREADRVALDNRHGEALASLVGIVDVEQTGVALRDLGQILDPDRDDLRAAAGDRERERRCGISLCRRSG